MCVSDADAIRDELNIPTLWTAALLSAKLYNSFVVQQFFKYLGIFITKRLHNIVRIELR